MSCPWARKSPLFSSEPSERLRGLWSGAWYREVASGHDSRTALRCHPQELLWMGLAALDIDILMCIPHLFFTLLYRKLPHRKVFKDDLDHPLSLPQETQRGEISYLKIKKVIGSTGQIWAVSPNSFLGTMIRGRRIAGRSFWVQYLVLKLAGLPNTGF